MQEQTISVICETRDDVGVISVSGPMTAATTDVFRSRFDAWQRNGNTAVNVVLDLEGVEVMDSAGMGAIMGVLKRVSERGGDMRIANLRRKPQMVFEITRAYRLFEIFDSIDAAIGSFRESAGDQP